MNFKCLIIEYQVSMNTNTNTYAMLIAQIPTATPLWSQTEHINYVVVAAAAAAAPHPAFFRKLCGTLISVGVTRAVLRTKSYRDTHLAPSRGGTKTTSAAPVGLVILSLFSVPGPKLPLTASERKYAKKVIKNDNFLSILSLSPGFLGENITPLNYYQVLYPYYLIPWGGTPR